MTLVCKDESRNSEFFLAFEIALSAKAPVGSRFGEEQKQHLRVIAITPQIPETKALNIRAPRKKLF
jgi:hypothetical protein